MGLQLWIFLGGEGGSSIEDGLTTGSPQAGTTDEAKAIGFRVTTLYFLRWGGGSIDVELTREGQVARMI